jgi:hypothetical protein
MPEHEEDEASEESELEEQIEDSEEEIDDESFRRFIGNWSMESVSPSLERTNARMPQASLENFEDIQATTISPAQMAEEEFRKYSPPNIREYNVMAEEEIRRYEIAQAGVNPPVLVPEFIEDFSPRLINPFAGRNIERENIRPEDVETRHRSDRKKLPFEKDDKYRK